MSGKRYYWLKLNENFFEDDTISWIEEQDNGKDYIIFYLKLCLKSISNEGYLVRYVGEKLIPYDVKALGKLTNTPPDTVAVAMKTFIDIGLIVRMDSGEIFMNQINEMIGTETASAKRMRKKRILDQVKQLDPPSQSDNDVHLSDTEKEIEKEIDIEKDKELVDEVADEISIQQVFLFYQKNFGVMSPYLQEDLAYWVNDLSAVLVIEAMKRAIEGQKNYNYAKGILKNWLTSNVKSLDDIEAKESQHERSKQQRKPYGKQKMVKDTPDWMDQSIKKPVQPAVKQLTDEELQANGDAIKARMASMFGDSNE